MAKTLHIDIETFSKAPLPKTGVYRYAEDPSFEVLLFGVAIDDDPVKVYDLKLGEKIPKDILAALQDNTVTKWAFNAQFERVCLSRLLWDMKLLPWGTYLDPRGWRCDMVWAGYMGFPMNLKGAGAALNLDEQKMEEGKSLITYFCKPYRETSINGYTRRNLPEHSMDKWLLFKSYNQRDVEVEIAIAKKLEAHPVPESIWEEYWMDQIINDRGILVDIPMVEGAIELDSMSKAHLKEEMRTITQLANPQSIQQMQMWLKENGVELDSLGKKELEKELDGIEEPMRTVLLLRQQLAMSAVKKYQAMDTAACSDGRCRGMFQFYGANRSGRFAGRIVQLQNLFRNSMPDLDEARALVKTSDYEAISALYDSIPEVLAQCVRTAFIPAPGYKFIVSDFSAIEARVIAWLAGEQWRMDAFARGDDIYCASASQMFGVPVEKHGVNGHLRQKGKQAELACIAEGSPVLTDQGLVPIEKVTTDMKVWDGKEWVHHDGVVYRGEREVITYDGLTATPDHLVWVEGQSWPVQFGFAAASGAHLVQTGDGRRAVRLGEDNQPGEEMESETEPLLCSDAVPGMRSDSVAEPKQSNKWQIEGVSKLHAKKTDTTLAGEKTDGGKTAMRESKRFRLSQLWSERYKVQLPKCNGSWTLFDSGVWIAEQKNGTGSHRYKWGLCSWQYTICRKRGKHWQPSFDSTVGVASGILAVCQECGYQNAILGENAGRNHRVGTKSSGGEKEELAAYRCTARLYDIRNAGPHHRFTVSGHLVHNCGYGGSVGALKAMGAIEMGLTEEELQPLVTAWRAANPNIVKLWWAVDKAVKTAVKEKTTTRTHGLEFKYRGGMLYIKLPSGRHLSYVKPRIGQNRFGGESVTYMGTDFTRHWSRIESYGPKFVENIVQGISRDILCHALEQLRDYRVVAHVHDECIVEVPPSTTVEEISDKMSTVPSWATDLILRADGYECPGYYLKD